MVGEDGWAVPFGGAPDHHVQKAIRCLNVMFLEGRDKAGHSGRPPLLVLLGNEAVGQPGGCWACGASTWSTPFSSPQAAPREDRPDGAPFPGPFGTGM